MTIRAGQRVAATYLRRMAEAGHSGPHGWPLLLLAAALHCLGQPAAASPYACSDIAPTSLEVCPDAVCPEADASAAFACVEMVPAAECAESDPVAVPAGLEPVPDVARPAGSADDPIGPPPAGHGSAGSLPNSLAQDGEGPYDQPPYARRNFFKRVFTDQKYLVTTWWPAEFRRPTFYAPLLAATLLAAQDGGPGGSGSFDVEAGHRIDHGIEGNGNSLAEGFTKLGNGAVIATALGTTYLLSRWRGNDRLTETASLSAEALADAGIWVTALKLVFARTRPGENSRGSFFDHNPPPGEQNGSFPSGHAMGAFSVAAVFAEQYRDHPWVPWVAYSVAGLIGASRVALARHFPTDVVVGAMLGQSIGRMVVYRARETDEARGYSFAPIVNPETQTYGLAFTASW